MNYIVKQATEFARSVTVVASQHIWCSLAAEISETMVYVSFSIIITAL